MLHHTACYMLLLVIMLNNTMAFQLKTVPHFINLLLCQGMQKWKLMEEAVCFCSSFQPCHCRCRLIWYTRKEAMILYLDSQPNSDSSVAKGAILLTTGSPQGSGIPSTSGQHSGTFGSALRGNVPVRCFLFTGTVSVRCSLFTGTVPMRCSLFTSTVPVNNLFL